MRPPLCSPTYSPLLSPPLFSSSPLPLFFTRRPPAFRPLSALRETKKQPTRQKASSNTPQNFRLDNRKGGRDERPADAGDGDAGGDAALKGTVLAVLLLVGVVGGFGSVGYIYRDQINAFLTQFTAIIEGYGPAGYALFVLVYAGLEGRYGATYQQQEVSMEALDDFCRQRTFMAEMYANLDCDITCSNVFENLANLPSKSALNCPLSAMYVLAWDGLIAMIQAKASLKKKQGSTLNKYLEMVTEEVLTVEAMTEDSYSTESSLSDKGRMMRTSTRGPKYETHALAAKLRSTTKLTQVARSPDMKTSRGVRVCGVEAYDICGAPS